jgi:hypothetical protein
MSVSPSGHDRSRHRDARWQGQFQDPAIAEASIDRLGNPSDSMKIGGCSHVKNSVQSNHLSGQGTRLFLGLSLCSEWVKENRYFRGQNRRQLATRPELLSISYARPLQDTIDTYRLRS